MTREGMVLDYTEETSITSFNKGCIMKEKICDEFMEMWKTNQLGILSSNYII